MNCPEMTVGLSPPQLPLPDRRESGPATLYVLAACVFTLLLLGALALNSAAVFRPEPRRFHAHLILMIVGLVGAGILALVPYRWFQRRVGAADRWPARWHWVAELRLPSVFLGLAVLQLVLVLIPGLGELRNGARRWAVWGGQPSELAKLALILALADDLARHPLPVVSRLRHLLRPAGYAGVVALLILVEPDWGGALVTTLVAAGMLLLAGARWFHLLSGAIILGLLGLHALLLDPHRLGRVLSFGNPELFQHGAGFQQWRSLLAIGNGGWTGRLPGEGSFKDKYVPEQETDFIFSLLAEEMGLIGVSAVLLVYIAMLGCGWRLASRTRDPFGQYLAAGITLWITLQALIHVGVNTSSLPNKGLPLPLVSYGGSNLLCLLAGLGWLSSIARNAPPARRPDLALRGRAQWAIVARRLWRLVQGPRSRPLQHPYQLPPTPASPRSCPSRPWAQAGVSMSCTR